MIDSPRSQGHLGETELPARALFFGAADSSPRIHMSQATPSARPRGIEHIGITVPDHAAAVHFFEAAFGAKVLFSLVDKSRAPLTAEEVGAQNGLLPGTAIVAVSMLRFQNGANLEIFEIDAPRHTGERGISDMGISHFSVTVDDIEAVTAAFAAAGGKLLEGPYPLMGQEAGPGNRGRFGLTPWGLLIEFERLPSPMDYDEDTEAQRWIPEPPASDE
ncbi:VOC family protein [Pseudenhygromyxa sp. WMMC2535]|uniref:VOC family protein n=1 Tax=Pseudenhygromyxa sp. WMMC2535 TaxID=2712867 RepID=UPI00155217DC|nr:VOC family protein [Pseudenhygromyxa sp. WMMC2535]NVB39985.1 VOC family protein [Pseudenhygromyxa sp. WMMC2535]